MLGSFTPGAGAMPEGRTACKEKPPRRVIEGGRLTREREPTGDITLATEWLQEQVWGHTDYSRRAWRRRSARATILSRAAWRERVRGGRAGGKPERA
jgi:hypothetical protein